jgi:beta-glucosidase
MQILKFPKDFLWGAATSAHQIEGNNTDSDWWAWEYSIKRHDFLVAHGKNPKDYESGLACDSYHRFDEDFTLAQYLNHNATRLSIEWSRIEPKEGEFSEKELDHYEKVLQSAKFHGLTTFVTLHHFTSPLWFARKGGFGRSANIRHFIKYVRLAVKRLDQYVDFWLTFNEPEVYVSMSYITGVWPPQHYNLFEALRVVKNLIATHNAVVPEIKLLSHKPVSMAYNMTDLQPTGKMTRWLIKSIYDKINRYVFFRTQSKNDFLGVNYYFHHHLEIYGKRWHSHRHHETSDIGWGIHPEGLEHVLLRLKKYHKPIYITENGVADAHDILREKFIKDHLYHLYRAIKKGADVRGYLHWSLLDNFEWEKGFAPRFGLVAINRESLLERKIRYSALKYAEICKNNSLEY